LLAQLGAQRFDPDDEVLWDVMDGSLHPNGNGGYCRACTR
jgi:hypothetical protein